MSWDAEIAKRCSHNSLVHRNDASASRYNYKITPHVTECEFVAPTNVSFDVMFMLDRELSIRPLHLVHVKHSTQSLIAEEPCAN
jgi:hypothetical protein